MMKVLSITLVTGSGPDLLILELDLPSGTFPFNANQEAKLEVAAGTGMDYIAKHFPDVSLKCYPL